jgi:hypothetical protein
MLEQALMLQASTLVDSSLATTRIYWRKEIFGLSDEIANDPRSLSVILAESEVR